MSKRLRLGICCALFFAGYLPSTVNAFGADAQENVTPVQKTSPASRGKNTPKAQSKPDGVLANAATAAAAAADTASAAANAADAAAKAALSALDAINSILPPSQRQPHQTPLRTPAPAKDKAVPSVSELPPDQPPVIEPQPLESFPQEFETSSMLGESGDSAKFETPEQQTLVGLIGKFELPVFVDTGGEFVKSLPGDSEIGGEAAAPLGETNLDESVSAGRSFSRESLAANARVEQAQAQTGQAFGLLLPSVSVRASNGDETSTPSVALGNDGQPIPSETHSRKDLTFTVRQPLFDLPSYFDWQRRKVVEQARAESHRVTDGDAYLATSNSYLSLVLTRIQADLTREFEVQLKDLLVYIEKRARAGAASGSDMDRVRARSQAAMSARLEYESAHAAAGIEFVRLTNVVPRMVRLPEPDTIGAAQMPDSLGHAVGAAMTTNPEIASLAAEVQAARIDKSAAKGRYLPRLDVEYSDNKSLHAGGDTDPDGQRDQRIMLVLNASLFNGGSDYQYNNERSARYSELKYRMDDQRRRIVQELSANYATLASIRGRITVGYGELKSISMAAEAMSKRMFSGNQSLLDLLDVYDRHYQARARLVDLHIREMITITQIVRLVKGTPEMIGGLPVPAAPEADQPSKDLSGSRIVVEPIVYARSGGVKE